MNEAVPAPTGRRSPRWAFMQRMVIPCENGENYLVRLRIIQTPWFGVYLHDLEAPDSDPHPHDHPWVFWSFIVRGAYEEEVYYFPKHPIHYPAAVPRYWRRFSWHKMPMNWAHRIGWVKPGTKSLIFVGKRRANWFFYVKGEAFPWQEYEKTHRKA